MIDARTPAQIARDDARTNDDGRACRYRALDTSLGRWTRQDPAGFVDGGSTYQNLVTSPNNLNDPYGLEAKQSDLKAHVELENGRIQNGTVTLSDKDLEDVRNIFKNGDIAITGKIRVDITGPNAKFAEGYLKHQLPPTKREREKDGSQPKGRKELYTHKVTFKFKIRRFLLPFNVTIEADNVTLYYY